MTTCSCGPAPPRSSASTPSGSTTTSTRPCCRTRPSFEGWTLASFLLAQTTRLRLGHLVLCNNFRHPALLAKMATTLDVCSGGRFEFGLGSGSVEDEHLRTGLPWGSFPERSERLAEALQIVTDMFAQEQTSFVGRHYEIHDVPNLPPPVQRPRPPIHVGGIGLRHTLPLVARYADVWNVPTYGLADWQAKEAVLEGECAKIGRDPATIRRSHQAVLVLAADEQALPDGDGEGATALPRLDVGARGRRATSAPLP